MVIRKDPIVSVAVSKVLPHEKRRRVACNVVNASEGKEQTDQKIKSQFDDLFASISLLEIEEEIEEELSLNIYNIICFVCTKVKNTNDFFPSKKGWLLKQMVIYRKKWKRKEGFLMNVDSSAIRQTHAI